MTVEAVHKSYEAFNRGDLAAALAMMDDGIVWHQAQGLPHGGVYNGLAAVRASVFDPIEDAWWEDFRADPDEVIGLGDDVVVIGRYTAKAKQTGNPLDVPFAHLWRFRGRPRGAISPVHRHARLGRGARRRRMRTGARHGLRNCAALSACRHLQGLRGENRCQARVK